MATVDLDDLENAMMMVGASTYEARGYVCRKTGRIYIVSDLGLEDEEELPPDLDTSDQYVAVPNSDDLDLGHEVVVRFTQQYLPQDEQLVHQIFRKKGAYGRFGRLVADRGVRDEWHKFREQETAAALRDWAKGHGLDVKA